MERSRNFYKIVLDTIKYSFLILNTKDLEQSPRSFIFRLKNNLQRRLLIENLLRHILFDMKSTKTGNSGYFKNYDTNKRTGWNKICTVR